MGCTASKAVDEETRRSKAIDREQRTSKTELERTAQVLFMGTGDSGKTTLRKQLTNVHGNKFKSEEARIRYASVILCNILEGVVAVLSIMEGEKYHALHDQMRKELQLSERLSYFSSEVATGLLDLIFNNAEFERAKNSTTREVQLQDCWAVFAEQLKSYPTWAGPGWIPSVEDCIRSRARTTGVVREVIEVDGTEICIHDVGGQRAERRKWLHSFENMTTVVFVAALSEYDQFLFEDHSKNRLEEALELFADAVNSPWLKKSSLLLFLNKKDLFDEKYSKRRIPLNVSGRFASAPTGNDDPAGAVQWIKDQFDVKCDRDDLIVHVTTAVDPQNVRAVFDACKENVMKKALEQTFGLDM